MCIIYCSYQVFVVRNHLADSAVCSLGLDLDSQIHQQLFASADIRIIACRYIKIAYQRAPRPAIASSGSYDYSCSPEWCCGSSCGVWILRSLAIVTKKRIRTVLAKDTVGHIFIERHLDKEAQSEGATYSMSILAFDYRDRAKNLCSSYRRSAGESCQGWCISGAPCR